MLVTSNDPRIDSRARCRDIAQQGPALVTHLRKRFQINSAKRNPFSISASEMRAVAGEEAFNWPINMVNQKLTWLGKGERRARKSGCMASGGGAGMLVGYCDGWEPICCTLFTYFRPGTWQSCRNFTIVQTTKAE